MDTYQFLALLCLSLGGLIFLSEMISPSKAPKSLSSSTNGSISSGSSSQSPRLRTAYAVLDAYKHLSPAALTAPLAPNFTQTLLPSSMNQPTRDLASFEKHAGMVTSIFSSFAMLPIPGQVYEAPEQNAVIAHCRMVGELKMGLGPWENECVIFLRFDEAGEKVVEHREFVDSARAALLREKLMGAKGGAGPQNGSANKVASESFTRA